MLGSRLAVRSLPSWDQPSVPLPLVIGQFAVHTAMITAALLVGLSLCVSADPKPFMLGMLKTGNNQLTIKNYEIKNCSNNNLIQLEKLSVRIDDDYVIITVTFSVNEDIDALAITVVIKYRGFLKWPCENGLGSCSYSNVCAILNKNTDTCKKEMETLNINLPCECPVKKGNYSSQEFKLHVPDHMRNMMKGNHYARIEGSMDGEKRMCYEIRIDVTM